MISIQRIYQKGQKAGGYRVLVDGVWPRGISKEEAAIDEWNKSLAPSTKLRKWFGHKPELFEAFRQQYLDELKGQAVELKRLKQLSAGQDVTLLYGAKDPKVNQAVVLLEALNRVQP